MNNDIANTLKETPYFPASELPGCPGVFKRRTHLSVDPEDAKTEFSYWDGEYWHTGGDTPDDAVLTPLVKSHFQKGLWEDFEWCGLVPNDNIAEMSDADGVIQSEKSEPVADKPVSIDSFFAQGVAHDEPAEPEPSEFFNTEDGQAEEGEMADFFRV